MKRRRRDETINEKRNGDRKTNTYIAGLHTYIAKCVALRTKQLLLSTFPKQLSTPNTQNQHTDALVSVFEVVRNVVVVFGRVNGQILKSHAKFDGCFAPG